jgi:hypothetical protein
MKKATGQRKMGVTLEKNQYQVNHAGLSPKAF